MKLGAWFATLCSGAVISTWASVVLAQTIDLPRFRQLRAEGVAAANAGDLGTASQRLEAAGLLLPAHPGLLLMRARVAAAAGQTAQSVDLLNRYADLGLYTDLAGDPTFVEAQTWPGYNAVGERLRLNRHPTGSPVQVLRDETLRLLEGMVWWRAQDRLLVSSIRERTILQLLPKGGLAPYLDESQPLGILGLAIDEDRNRLWAAASGTAAADVSDSDRGRTELIEIELTSGRILGRHRPPAAARRNFGDVAVGRGGIVAVSDSANGDVFLLRPGAAELELLTPPGRLGSPQGMVFSDDGTALIIADYSSTLHRVELATGEAVALPSPAGSTLIAIDGMVASADGVVWAVQNGVSPNRLLKLEMGPDWRSVDRVTAVVANLPEMDQPSGVAVSDRGVALIQQSQWGAFDNAGMPKPGQAQAAVISVLSPTGAR